MSVQALTWSFQLPLHDMAAKAALHALADHADADWKCWPSMERIALFAGCNIKTARKAIQRLVDLGAIDRISRPGTSDFFQINRDWNPSLNRESLNRDPSLNRDLPKRALTPPKNDPDPSLNREGNHQNPQEEDLAFSEFALIASKHNWPKPRKLDSDRRKKLRARLDEHGIVGWHEMLERAGASEFIKTKFALRLDWVLEPRNFRKVIEGNYDNKSNGAHGVRDEPWTI